MTIRITDEDDGLNKDYILLSSDDKQYFLNDWIKFTGETYKGYECIAKVEYKSELDSIIGMALSFESLDKRISYKWRKPGEEVIVRVALLDTVCDITTNDNRIFFCNIEEHKSNNIDENKETSDK